jgi:diadenosine tetraphosphate (Ap4A) HIT family hydrolase
MAVIFETQDFFVDTPDSKPHHSRSNGGHIVVRQKQHFAHRHEMPLALAAGLTHLSMVAGEAAINVLKQKGLDIVRINYQDNGNWAYLPGSNKEPSVHVHLYIRTTHEKHPDGDSRFQAFPNALVFPSPPTNYYDNFKPLTAEDCADIKNEILSLLKTDKYQKVEFS